MKSLIWILVLTHVAGMLAGCGGTAAFYVSPTGNDDDPGTLQRPFATLERARAAARQLIRDEQTAGHNGITVYLRGGTYRRTEPLVLGGEDSGSAGAPVRWRAYGGEQVRISGGAEIPLSAFEKVRDADTRKRLGSKAAEKIRVVALGPLNIEPRPWPAQTRSGYQGRMEVFFNDKPMPCARWPNSGWALTGEVVDRGTRLFWHVEGDPHRGGTFKYADDRPERWSVERGVWIAGYLGCHWLDQAVRVEAIDTKARTIKLSWSVAYGLQADHRWRAVNLPEELDEPGEWFLDVPGRRLFFYPPPEAKDEDRIVLSVLAEPLLGLKDASHVVLEQLTFETGCGDAVTIDGGADCRVQDCVIRNMGGEAVKVSGGARHGVVGCTIAHTGAGGVSITAGDRPTLTPGECFVTDCDIFDFARLARAWRPGIALAGVGNRAAHNRVHDSPHLGISYYGNEHTIEFNELYNLCWEAEDNGAIYTGREWSGRGTKVQYNFIHHVTGYAAVGAQGIYLDDMACGNIIRGNILYKVQRAMMIGGGRDNIIEDNLAYECDKALWFDSRGMGKQRHSAEVDGGWRKALLEMPYTKPPWSTRYPKLVGILDDPVWPGAPRGNIMRRNVFVKCGGKVISPAVSEYSTLEDNLFVDDDAALRLDVRPRPESPVFDKIPRLKQMPLSKIGPREP
ncbi:MAG: right-handed parallel beta-helix repeat-containing protein [Planctomycetota bacterium]